MLETEIKNLTKAIKELTEVMTCAAQEMKENAEYIVEQGENVEEVEAPTYDDLRSAILNANRANPKNKAVMKELLSKFGAKKVTDVSIDNVSALLAEIEKVVS